MKYLLDTNVWIDVARVRGNRRVQQRFEAVDRSQLVLSSVVRAELLLGVLKMPLARPGLKEIAGFAATCTTLDFDNAAAEHYAIIRHHLESIGRSIGANDLLIAASARSRGLILVTHNVVEFARVPGLVIEDWQDEAAPPVDELK